MKGLTMRMVLLSAVTAAALAVFGHGVLGRLLGAVAREIVRAT
jgi:hypothetical protein